MGVLSSSHKMRDCLPMKMWVVVVVTGLLPGLVPATTVSGIDDHIDVLAAMANLQIPEHRPLLNPDIFDVFGRGPAEIGKLSNKAIEFAFLERNFSFEIKEVFERDFLEKEKKVKDQSGLDKRGSLKATQDGCSIDPIKPNPVDPEVSPE